MNEVFLDDYIKTKDGRIGIVNLGGNDKALVAFFDDESELMINVKDIASVLPGNESLNISDRVKLEPIFYKNNEEENPHDCEGTITDFDGYWYYVDWDNGKWNTYRKLDADLILVSREEVLED